MIMQQPKIWLPGPAGKLQARKAADNASSATSNGHGSGHPQATGPRPTGSAGGPSPAVRHPSQDVDLSQPTWGQALLACTGSTEYNGSHPLFVNTIAACSNVPFSKVSKLLVLVVGITFTPCGDVFATLKDATGVMRGAMDRAVLTDIRKIKTGSTLLLQQVPVFMTKPGQPVLCINPGNILQVFPVASRPPRQPSTPAPLPAHQDNTSQRHTYPQSQAARQTQQEHHQRQEQHASGHQSPHHKQQLQQPQDRQQQRNTSCDVPTAPAIPPAPGIVINGSNGQQQAVSTNPQTRVTGHPGSCTTFVTDRAVAVPLQEYLNRTSIHHSRPQQQQQDQQQQQQQHFPLQEEDFSTPASLHEFLSAASQRPNVPPRLAPAASIAAMLSDQTLPGAVGTAIFHSNQTTHAPHAPLQHKSAIHVSAAHQSMPPPAPRDRTTVVPAAVIAVAVNPLLSRAQLPPPRPRRAAPVTTTSSPLPGQLQDLNMSSNLVQPAMTETACAGGAFGQKAALVRNPIDLSHSALASLLTGAAASKPAAAEAAAAAAAASMIGEQPAPSTSKSSLVIGLEDDEENELDDDVLPCFNPMHPVSKLSMPSHTPQAVAGGAQLAAPIDLRPSPGARGGTSRVATGQAVALAGVTETVGLGRAMVHVGQGPPLQGGAHGGGQPLGSGLQMLQQQRQQERLAQGHKQAQGEQQQRIQNNHASPTPGRSLFAGMKRTTDQPSPEPPRNSPMGPPMAAQQSNSTTTSSRYPPISFRGNNASQTTAAAHTVNSSVHRSMPPLAHAHSALSLPPPDQQAANLPLGGQVCLMGGSDGTSNLSQASMSCSQQVAGFGILSTRTAHPCGKQGGVSHSNVQRTGFVGEAAHLNVMRGGVAEVSVNVNGSGGQCASIADLAQAGLDSDEDFSLDGLDEL